MARGRWLGIGFVAAGLALLALAAAPWLPSLAQDNRVHYHDLALRTHAFTWWNLAYAAGAPDCEHAPYISYRRDLVNTGIGGSFMGEALFRLASLLLENDDVPTVWREVGAALIQPSTAFQRFAFGERFDRVFESRNPAIYSRADVGFSGTAEQTTGTSTTKLDRNELQADYAIDYGLPGKPGYRYRRPFDLFSFQSTVSSANKAPTPIARPLDSNTTSRVFSRRNGDWAVAGTAAVIAASTQAHDAT